MSQKIILLIVVRLIFEQLHELKLVLDFLIDFIFVVQLEPILNTVHKLLVDQLAIRKLTDLLFRKFSRLDDVREAVLNFQILHNGVLNFMSLVSDKQVHLVYFISSGFQRLKADFGLFFVQVSIIL